MKKELINPLTNFDHNVVTLTKDEFKQICEKYYHETNFIDDVWTVYPEATCKEIFEIHFEQLWKNI
jgi:hypothetical protein